MTTIQLVVSGLLIAGIVAVEADAQPGGIRSVRSAAVIIMPGEEPADSIFRLGRQAIADADYRRAANLFKMVVDRYPQSKSAGDALYWRAWSLQKLGAERRNQRDLDDALEAISRLENDYPKATTLADARVLATTIRNTKASLGDASAARAVAGEAKGVAEQRTCPASTVDDETRMAALDGLLSMNSADAIPILQEVLKQRAPCREELRKKAVFLISQKSGPEVATTLLDVARNDPSNDVRGQAIQWLSQTRSEAAIPALDSVLFQSTDQDLRKKAIFALSQLSRDDRARAALQRAAQDERMSEDIREEAVFWLGQSRTVDLAFFKTLFTNTRNADLRKKIMFSVAQHSSPESTAWLLDVARNRNLDIDVRKEAIFWLSQSRAVDLDGLQNIYNASRDEPEIQKQVIFVYSQRREPAVVDKLIEIAKSDPKLENRKEAIFWLGQKNDPRVKQFLRELINKP
jgi:HEAT repeat protein